MRATDIMLCTRNKNSSRLIIRLMYSIDFFAMAAYCNLLFTESEILTKHVQHLVHNFCGDLT